MQQTFDIFSFGCRVNQAETENIAKQLLKTGFIWNKNNPQLFIINTCAVTAKAEREARQFIYQTRRKFPKTKIVITGCAATKWFQDKAVFNNKDLILIGNQHKEEIAGIICSWYKYKIPGVSSYHTPGVGKNKFTGSGRLLIKIQDGCHRFCSYCIVPYLRGQPKSRKIDEIVSEIKENEDKIQEVILTAINTEAYGCDTNESFTDLLRSVIFKTKIPRISLGSVNPWSITEEFLDFYQKNIKQKRLVDFFHIPLQSGSNKILQHMKRGYTTEEFLEKLTAIKKINPLAFLATDVIVGFLEETNGDFKKTYHFLEQSPVSKFHVFRFSLREKTAAFFMAKKLKQVSDFVKKERSLSLIKLSDKKYQQFLENHLNHYFEALILPTTINNFQKILLSNQISALVRCKKQQIGTIQKVKITDLRDHQLLAKIN